MDSTNEIHRGLFVEIWESRRKINFPEMSKHWSVGSIKIEIQRQENISWDIMDLRHGTRVMEDSELASSYGVEDGDTIYMTIREGVRVMALSGKKISIREARPNWSVGQLKAAVAAASGIPEKLVQLLYRNGMMYPNNRTLDSFNIQPEENIILTHRPDGGTIL